MMYAEARPGRVFVLRLEEGEILHESVENFAREQGIRAAALIAVGGAGAGSRLVVGPADGAARPIEPMELHLGDVHETAGVGTVFPDEEGNPILHMHAACGRAEAARTGCVRRGVRVWQIMEIVLRDLAGTEGSGSSIVLILFFQAAAFFLSARTLGWIWGWVYLGVYVATMAAVTITVLPRRPDLIAERGRIGEGTKSWDKTLAALVSFLGPMAILILAGLDERFLWSPWLEPARHYPGLGAMILGYALFAWTMAANAFFSGTVRIQRERGQAVADRGPYRFVRHPGYLGMLLHTLGTPFLLGSYWALIPAGLTAGLLSLRTALEDRTLRAELPGYGEYANRVRYRLVPGVW